MPRAPGTISSVAASGTEQIRGRSMGFLARTSVGELKGVGPKSVEALEEMGISTVLDLICHYPRRYLDRTQQASLANMVPGEQAVVLASVRRTSSRPLRGRRRLVEVDVHDGTGWLRCTFFNQPWRERQLSEGTQVALFGKLELYQGRRQMTNPVVDLVGDRTRRIVAVYPSSEKAGVATWEIASWVDEALRRAGPLADPLPSEWRSRLGLADRTSAFRGIHVPESLREKEVARRRLAFDELLRLQIVLVMRKRLLEYRSEGISHRLCRAGAPDGSGGSDSSLLDELITELPFKLTQAQLTAIEEVCADMASEHPMHRLLQGDVGAGKTVVALAGLLVAVQSGHQGLLMAPTEVLAEQHYFGLRSLLAKMTVQDTGRIEARRPVCVELLTNRTSRGRRDRLSEQLRTGEVDILVGTHALLGQDVRLASAGLVVIDEQHRFGVEQRAVLRDQGRIGTGKTPDLLVMTATPIPRTAAMTVYGDLDVSVLGELPQGRVPVTTKWVREPSSETAVWEKVRSEIAAGRRAYIVCPLIEGSDRMEARAVVAEHKRLQEGPLAGVALALLHGQMPSREKEAVMTAFRDGDVGALVTTTVIEVGVDIAEATVMVVEDAGRFGLAQLHQLRGRVGRSGLPSWCYLLDWSASEDGVRRLEALERTTDGFALAEVDLEIRGEGTVLGTRQQGRNDLRLASLRKDQELVLAARRVAEDLVGRDSTLHAHPLLADELRLFIDEEDEAFLFKS